VLWHWHEAGVWQPLHELLLAELNAAGALDWFKAVIDSSHLRALKGGPNPPAAAPNMALAWACTAGWWSSRSRCCTGSGGCVSAGRSATTSHEAFLSLACSIICWRRLTNLALC
jgi:hypothetical protein